MSRTKRTFAGVDISNGAVKLSNAVYNKNDQEGVTAKGGLMSGGAAAFSPSQGSSAGSTSSTASNSSSDGSSVFSPSSTNHNVATVNFAGSGSVQQAPSPSLRALLDLGGPGRGQNRGSGGGGQNGLTQQQPNIATTSATSTDASLAAIYMAKIEEQKQACAWKMQIRNVMEQAKQNTANNFQQILPAFLNPSATVEERLQIWQLVTGLAISPLVEMVNYASKEAERDALILCQEMSGHLDTLLKFEVIRGNNAAANLQQQEASTTAAATSKTAAIQGESTTARPSPSKKQKIAGKEGPISPNPVGEEELASFEKKQAATTSAAADEVAVTSL